MSNDIFKNPIFQSLYAIHKDEVVGNFVDAYLECEKELGNSFEILMIELSEEIFELQAKCKRGTTIFEVAILLTIPDEESDEEEIKSYKYIKAAAVWLMLNEIK